LNPLARLLLAAIAFGALASCAPNPVTGAPDFVIMSEGQEVTLGRRHDQDVKKQYTLYDHKGLQARIEAIGQKLARVSHRTNLEYRFTLLDSPEVNAFALPGGYIYITRGILAFLNSEAEVAAVLAHELGHVTARHGVRQASAQTGTELLLGVLGAVSPAMRASGAQNMTGLLGNALLAGYGRDHELEADRLGAEYLARAGYDPQAMIRVIGVLKNQEKFDAQLAKQEGREARRYHGVFASHPDNDARLKEVVSAADRLRSTAITDDRSGYLAGIEGMIFGDSAREGVRRGNAYYHPELGFALQVPQGWRLDNLPDRLLLTAIGGAAQLEVRVDKKPNDSPSDLLRRLTRGAATDIDVSLVDKLPAARAELRGRFLAAIYMGSNVFLFNGAAQNEEAFRRSAEGMRQFVRSFHALSAEERKLARPLTLKLVKAGADTRFATLARSSPLGAQSEGWLRLINAIYPSGEPAPGQTIKVVE
jgi:predicted Zn-dependent protease